MKLYFSPLTSSLASRITCYEAGLDVTFVEVDLKRKRTQDDQDFAKVSPLGLVPALQICEGEVLVENAAVLQFLGSLRPEAGLLPTRVDEIRSLQQWLSLISSELHKGVYTPFFDASASDEAKAYALGKAASRLSWFERHLSGRQFLLEEFSVADALLFTVLNWSRVAPVPLDAYPTLVAYHARVGKRAAVARAFNEEFALYTRPSSSVKAARATGSVPL